jgi:two-component system, OmpR family, sensor histidine kinase KdpD
MRNLQTDRSRPSPDALLEEINKEHKGHLKIFLGASPGVGKTYAMLQAAHALKAEGIDVVVGIVESHKRLDTEALVNNLEIIPHKKITYRGIEFQELDLDSLIARKPKVALIDELAHTNIPGSRHPKRFHDVEELLANGIDVYSTLNIQHVESLNDVVSRISKVQVRETVPDSILQLADEIELIDLSPKDLQKRLKEGKVYVPEQARQAQDHFFSQGNLTALRELSLRYTAEHVDKQLLTYARAQGIQGNLPTRDRLMVCIGNDYGGLELVRNCSRMAERQKVSWIAVHVDTIGNTDTGNYLSDSLKLAHELGAEVVTLSGNEIAEELIKFAHARNVTRIIVGKARSKWWKPALFTTAGKLFKNSDTFEIVMIPTEDRVLLERQSVTKPKEKQHILNYVSATIAAFMAGGAAYFVDMFLSVPNLSLIFLAGVLFSSLRYGLLPALHTIFVSFIIYSFYFTDPKFSFDIKHDEHLLTLIFFVLVAITISNLTARIQSQIKLLKLNAKRTETLYEFSKKIASARDLQSVLRAVITHVNETLGGKTTILLPDEELLKIAAGYPELDDVSIGAAQWAWRHGEPAGHSCDTLTASPWLFMPMKTDTADIGILGIYFADTGKLLSQDDHRMLNTLSHQAAVAIERTQLSESIDEARVYAETERFRSALLSSISHDFRTPLASIMGSITSLQSYNKTLDMKTKNDLLETIHIEADRLNRFIQNLMDIMRYGAGALEPVKDWVELQDIFNAAIQRLKRSLMDRTIILSIPNDIPLLYADPVLLEQVVVNLIDNACKYSRKHSKITLSAYLETDYIVISCNDQGKGIPTEEREHVFDMFYRINAEDKQAAGTGLGLTICKGIIESHKGTINAVEGDNGQGNKIIIRLPLVVNNTNRLLPADAEAEDNL